MISRVLHQKEKKPKVCVLNLINRNIVLKSSHSLGEAHEVSSITVSWSVKVAKVVETQKTEGKQKIPGHLIDLVDRSKQNLKHREIQKLEDLILEYQDVFCQKRI